MHEFGGMFLSVFGIVWNLFDNSDCFFAILLGDARAGRYEQKFISRYFLADLWYTVYNKFLVCVNIPGNKAHSDSDISVFCVWIK